jgi:hypothetical protein
MALVALIAAILGLGIEVFVILPREHPRLQYAEMHWIRAEGFLKLANTTNYQLTPKLRQDFRDLSEWHRRRWDEIRKAAKFDLKAEERIDNEHYKIEDSILGEYAQETRSI